MYPVLCRGVFYPLVFGTTICPVPFLRHRPYYLAESDTFLFFTLYGLEDEDGKIDSGQRFGCSFLESSDVKSKSRMTARLLRIIQNRTFKDPEEKIYSDQLYELILRQLAFQNPDILNGLKYYNRQCDK